MMMSPTSEVTILPNAAPMITPTARSTTLPFIANSRNSLNIRKPRWSTPLTTIEAGQALVDQTGMHHGAAHGRSRGLGTRHHRQPQLLVHLAEQRQGVFQRRGVGLNEQGHV